ncbi:MAG: ABC transporter ATP-binding protein [Bacillaceae bacterium]|nr:ABC transporter ATP-binding protein [Bacillaceae bacterium]
MNKILELKEVSKSFQDFRLKNISFSLNPGYIMGFIGSNGAGKSTTIKLIMNLIKKDGGEIRIFGKDHIAAEQEIKQRIGFVYEANHFYEELTTEEMKKVIAPLYRNWDEREFRRYMEMFELPSNRKIKDLSRGMRMKFSLAIALSHHAELLIMDEPTSGLDPVVRSELLDLFSAFIQDENRAILFSTHITTDLDKIADYITFINRGNLVLHATKDDILDHYGVVKGGLELLDDDVKTMFVGLKQSRYGFEGLVEDRREAEQLMGQHVVIEKPSLEDIMVFYARRNQNG